MCTAVTYETRSFYFGRNLDLDCSYGESVAVTPRRCPFSFCRMGNMPTHYAIIGMAHVCEGYPLYYDATNEAGLSMAGLNFPGNAVYHPETPGRDNVAPFEFIPWVLGQCATLAQARALLERLNLTPLSFRGRFPVATLHWFLASRDGALTVESVAEGLRVYENPVGVLANNPPFPWHMTNLVNYMSLSSRPPENNLDPGLKLEPHSLGMGALGLPGDLSSPSRFVRAAFTRLHSRSGPEEAESVSQFFHILGSVAQTQGCVDLGEGRCERTVYSSCCNADTGVYYYTTYGNPQPTAVHLRREALDGSELAAYPLRTRRQVFQQN